MEEEDQVVLYALQVYQDAYRVLMSTHVICVKQDFTWELTINVILVSVQTLAVKSAFLKQEEFNVRNVQQDFIWIQ